MPHPTCHSACHHKAPRHGTPHALQVRRSTYHDVVKASDLSGLHVDLAGIQAYSINNAKVCVSSLPHAG